MHAPQGAEENGVTLTVSPLPHHTQCQLCPWESTDWPNGPGPVVLLLDHHASRHPRCPECGSVLVNRRCPRCDAGALS
mgnify:CR=1 FL=1